MFNPHEIDLRAPVEPGHPLNRGRRLWLLGHPYLAGGRTWYDLCGRANGALTNGPAWAATERGDAAVSMVAASSQFVACTGVDAAVTAASQVTLGLWVRRTAGTGSYFSRGGESSRFGLTWFTDNVLYCIADTGSGAAFGSVSLGALTGWHRLVLAWDGTATGNAARMRAWVNGVPRTLAYTGTIPAALQTTGQTLAVGRSWTTEAVYATGPHADASVWLGRQWSDVDAAADYDLSRRGYPGEYGPLRRVSNRGFLLLREADAGGGTAYEEAYASSITATGALTHVVSKAVAGSETGTGSLAKLAAKPLAGSATAAGDLARSTAKSMAGGLTGSGTVAKAASKATAGSTMPAGSVTRQAAKPLAGSTTPAGSVTLLRAALLAVAGSLTAAGALARAAWKSLAGLVTGAGGLTTSGGSGPPAPTPRVLTGTWAVPTLTGTWE